MKQRETKYLFSKKYRKNPFDFREIFNMFGTLYILILGGNGLYVIVFLFIVLFVLGVF